LRTTPIWACRCAQHQFTVEAVRDGRTGLARALEGAHDPILLDAMLPVLNGFEVLRRLRKQRSTRVIMLTARTAQRCRAADLKAGTFAPCRASDMAPGRSDPNVANHCTPHRPSALHIGNRGHRSVVLSGPRGRWD